MLKKIFNKLKNFWQKQSKIKKIIILFLLALLLYFIFKPKTDDDATSYQYTKVEKGRVSQVVSETGEITTANKTEIGTTINGVVIEVFVENGDLVEAGDKLFYVDSSATEAERSQAYSSYLTAKNSLESAKAKLSSLESSMWSAHEDFEARALDTELSVDDPIFIQTDRDWQAAEATYINQKDVIVQAQAALNSAWLNYQATLDGPVKATVAGQVANLAIAAGQTVAANDTALIIKTDSQVWVELAINENDIINVEPGQTAQLEIDALSDVSATATVERVDEFATIVSDVAVYYVYLSVNDEIVMARPGMTVQVDITTQEKNDVLVVPNSAIKPYQGEKAVQIMDEVTGTVVYQPIKLGVSGDINSEVLSGLNEGDRIIISGASSTNNNTGSGGGFLMGPGKI